MTDAVWWLLEVQVDGRVLRYSQTELLVLDEAGRSYVYRAGLSDLSVAVGEEEVEVEIVDGSVDWPLLAAAIEAGPCVLRRWSDGQLLEDAQVYTSGLATGVAHGSRDEPIGWVIGQPLGDETELGRQLPDTFAVIAEETWTAPNEEGLYYPLVFGAPGRNGEENPRAVMPVPAAIRTVAIICQFPPNQKANSVEVRNDEIDTSATLTTSIATDKLGRRLVTLPISGAVLPATDTEAPKLYVGFNVPPMGVRSAWEVIEFLLRRYGPETADWDRLIREADGLSAYQVDSWIDDVVENPWDWIEGFIGDLPYEVRRTQRGRYLERQRFVPTGDRVVLTAAVGQNAERDGGRQRSVEGPFTEYPVLYRPGITDEYEGRLVVTGSDGLQGVPSFVSAPASSTTELVKVVQDGRLARAQARWGVRQREAIELDWTWDSGTALAVADWHIERESVPQWLSSYWIRDGHQLEVGDEVLMTDPEFGLIDEPMIVDEPPVADRTRWAQVAVRYRAE